MPTLGASSFSVLGLPHALWGVSSTPASPPSLDAKATPKGPSSQPVTEEQLPGTCPQAYPSSHLPLGRHLATN